MNTLYFIGLGLFDEHDMTLKARHSCKDCTHIFAEFYTSMMMGTELSKIEEVIGKQITVLSREQTEKGDRVLSALHQGDVAFLTGGDSMTATTHVDLRIQAIKQGFNTEIIHGTSILTAVPSLLGLQHYKFGRVTTLVTPEKNYFPTSPYDVIKQNKTCDMHTMILLDIQQDKNYYMTATQGIKLLLEMEKQRDEQVIHPCDIVCVVGRAGAQNPVVASGRIEELLDQDFGPPLHTLVYPASLHFMEKEALSILSRC